MKIAVTADIHFGVGNDQHIVKKFVRQIPPGRWIRLTPRDFRSISCLAAGLGVGPRLTGSEPAVLPLHHPAM